MSFDVAIVGSFNFDMYCIVDNLPAKGETKISASSTTGCGGKGTNQCTQAARLGAKTVLICKIGSDSHGENLLSLCAKEDIDTIGIIQDTDALTGIAHITVDSQGENCIVVAPGANYTLSLEDIRHKEDIIKKTKVVVCQNEIREEVTLEALTIARRYGAITVMNAAPANGNFNQEIFALSDVFIVNCCEASQITNLQVTTKSEAEAAAKVLLTKGCKSAIITMGKDGLVYASECEQMFIPTTKVQAVDSSGAGDSFVGALAYFKSTFPAWNMEDVLKKSSYLAALSVQKIGAQGGLTRKADLPSWIFA